MNLTIENVEHITISANVPTKHPMLDAFIAAVIASAPKNDEEAAAAPAGHFSTPTPPPIGQLWPEQGGIYAGLMRGQDGNPDYHLIVAHKDDGEITNGPWGGYDHDEPKATSEWDGFANTVALVESEQSHPAADRIADMTIHGLDDWYLPARRELRLCYVNVPEAFDSEAWYWSSTQYSRYGAWNQGFGGGYQGSYYKSDEARARAVRRFIP